MGPARPNATLQEKTVASDDHHQDDDHPPILAMRRAAKTRHFWAEGGQHVFLCQLILRKFLAFCWPTPDGYHGFGLLWPAFSAHHAVGCVAKENARVVVRGSRSGHPSVVTPA